MSDASGGGRIRVLTVADLAAFRRVRAAALAAAPVAFGSTPEEDAALADSAVMVRLAEPNAVLGALIDGTLVGIAGFAPERGLKRCHRGLLRGVFVAPGYRRAGLARALVEAVIHHARGRVLILEASVAATNAPARALYDALGFVAYGLHRHALRVGEAFHDEMLIALDL